QSLSRLDTILEEHTSMISPRPAKLGEGASAANPVRAVKVPESRKPSALSQPSPASLRSPPLPASLGEGTAAMTASTVKFLFLSVLLQTSPANYDGRHQRP